MYLNLQRYEGGATLFGPNTLLAYQKQYGKLARRLFAVGNCLCD